MRHIQEYCLFEQVDRDNAAMLRTINTDSGVFPFLFKAEMAEDEVGLYDEDVKIKTPYGKEITVRFTSPDWDYSGEGDWDASIYAYDDYGIKYSCTGHIKSGGYPEDDGDATWDGVYADIQDPVLFCEKIFDIEPLVVSRVYQLLPDDKKQVVSLKLADKGFNQDLLKGSNILNRLRDI